MTPVLVPQLGNEITEAEVAEWLKAEGDTVDQGEPIVSISTTKMTFELDAPASGTLQKIIVPEGEIAEVGDTLAEIG
ncbi:MULTISPECIES: lipoyl domain-containing protein [unclassified Roseitalea]|uniref:lipoyl domain-containing protein n=1 Tax=unclassified Roseitalea TaxID=2639107 RepID=UPI00273DB8C0|nr:MULTISPECIES: lipoyl domain-containing protein [unclassified Roseitalea]